MPPKPSNWRMYAKMFFGGSILMIGGPSLVWYVTPTEEEIFQRYNPDLQKRSLENRLGRQQDFDDFVGKLKEYSKSDKPIWEAAAEDQANQKKGKIEEQEKLIAEMRRRRDLIRVETGGTVKPMPGGSSAMES